MRRRAAVRCRRRSSWSTLCGMGTPSVVRLYPVDSLEAAVTILTARSGDLDIAYEVLGDPGGEPLLLVMGLGAQMVGWSDGFCAELTARGFRVVRFDNRDVGLSTHLD